ncbi:hypothetical protein SESBI_01570 [Sesbania bispinosa]|nr:hypothetical protein SESBI_01570 [Sesbania bispinosa]
MSDSSRLFWNPQIPEAISFKNGIAEHGFNIDLPLGVIGDNERAYTLREEFITLFPRKTIEDLQLTEEAKKQLAIGSIEQMNALNLEHRDAGNALNLEHMPDFLSENVELTYDMDDEYVSDALESLSGSDGEGDVVSKERFPRFRKEDLCKEFKLEMEYASLKEFKDVILEHSVAAICYRGRILRCMSIDVIGEKVMNHAMDKLFHLSIVKEAPTQETTSGPVQVAVTAHDANTLDPHPETVSNLDKGEESQPKRERNNANPRQLIPKSV